MKIILILLLTSLIIFIGCSTEPDKSPELFKVKVDSISHTPFGATGDTLVVKVYGTIGNDGCCSFSRFEEMKQPLQLDLTVWGQRSSSGACPDVMIYLDGREYKWIATQQGWFIINIHQPDNTLLRDSIVIK